MDWLTENWRTIAEVVGIVLALLAPSPIPYRRRKKER